MADRDSNPIPRGLKKRRGTWQICRVFNGKLVRLSTKCADLQAAMEVYRRVELAHMKSSSEGWWADQMAAARDGKKSIFQSMLSAAKHRAKKDGWGCSLTMPQLLAIAEESGGRCSVSGVAFSDKQAGTRRPLAPSLDRIDSAKKEYSLANCRIVCVAVNYAMSDFGEHALRIIARGIVRRELEENMRDDSL